MTSEIWIVDDEPGILNMCRDYLQGSYMVKTFISPLEVLSCISNDSKPDLILTDIKMPELDGLELTDALRGAHPQLPILMMSGYADKSHILSGLAKGILGFIEKPFHPKQMKQIIDETIGKKHYIHLLEDLAIKYSVLKDAMLELNQEYISRYAAAENHLYNLNLPHSLGPEEAKAIIENIKRDNRLTHNLKVQMEELREVVKQKNLRAEPVALPRSVLLAEPAKKSRAS